MPNADYDSVREDNHNSDCGNSDSKEATSNHIDMDT